MIISPVKEWFRISQSFWWNKKAYEKFWMIWHNGQDIATPVWVKVTAPFDWIIELRDSWDKWYWKHIRLTEEYWTERRQVVLAHLLSYKDWIKHRQEVRAWEHIWFTWDSWNSTWPHLHFWLRRILKNWRVKNYDNGYLWYEDIHEKWWILQYLKSKY